MHCFFGTTIGAKSKHVYRQMLNITRNMGCTHLARAEPPISVFIIRRDTQFLIRPLGRVGIRKVTQHSIWVVPEAPENPEPHGRTEELGLDHLGSGQLWELSVPGLNVRTSTSPTDATGSSRPRAAASEEVASNVSERRQSLQNRHTSHR